jgi:hypothetical protein
MNKIIKVNDDILDSKHKIDSSFNNKVAAVFSNNTYCKTIIGYMKLKERKRLISEKEREWKKGKKRKRNK